MKKAGLSLILLFLMLGWDIAQADEAGELKNFARPDAFRSRYLEQKHLPSLSAPLKSEGDFIYIKDHGIAWLMSKPFSMQTVISPNGLSQWVEGEKQVQSAEAQKAMTPILQNISSIFNGDYEALKTQFEIKQGRMGEIELTPKSQHLKPYLQQIIITGTTTIESVKIINAPDKFTLTTFHTPVIGMDGITDEEMAIFDE